MVINNTITIALVHEQARREATGDPGQNGHPEDPPPNLQIMDYAPKRVSFGIKAFKAFWGILKDKAPTIWGPSE